MNTSELTLSGWLGAAFLALAAFTYVYNTGSQHTATNPDEYVYLQIARLTAATGHWLPLQAEEKKHRNTKPPALFWQGIASTGFGEHWELWRLRLPCALFSLATAALVFVVARKLAGTSSAGAVGALAYLAFLGVYRHGRVFLTSAPETFWLFLPFCLLVMRPDAAAGWGASIAFGLIFGAGLLCKSFAMIIPAAAALGWWTLQQRGYQTGRWLRNEAPKIALTALVALAVFALWFLFDPQRHFILQDFVLKENVGKFDADNSGYVATALWGKHSIWQYSLGWLTNAGLVAPAVLAVFLLGWRNRSRMTPSERLLWLWIITLFVFHLLPNLRYERYLLPAMPAVAALCGLYWERIPRWVIATSLAVCALVGVALLAGASLLARQLPDAYTATDWMLLVSILVFCVAGFFRKDWTRAFALPAVLLVYLGFALFLRPFDGPSGKFSSEAIACARGRMVVLPSPFTARNEVYSFLLPGANVTRIKEKNLPGALADTANKLFVLQTNMGTAPQTQGFRLIGRRLTLRDYFNAEETRDMLRGNVARQLFAWDWLVERE